MARNKYSTTAKEDIINALHDVPEDASLTLDQLTRSTNKARETIRGAAFQLITEKLVERIPVEGVSAYRLATRISRQKSTKKKRIESTAPSMSVLTSELRSLYDEKLKLELRISEVERQLIEGSA